jgi:Protein of unknown function (DUF1186)
VPAAPEASDLILGDAITSTLGGILISTYDGNLAALQAVIEAETADDFVREGALLALAYLNLTRTSRVSDAPQLARVRGSSHHQPAARGRAQRPLPMRQWEEVQQEVLPDRKRFSAALLQRGVCMCLLGSG